MSETYTWLASYPKSGNTWVRLLLIAYRTNGMVDINNTGYIRSDNVPYYTNIVSPLPLSSLNARVKFLLRPAALVHQLASHVEDPKFIKTHHANIRGVETSPYIPLDVTTRAIHIIRDPRDVALSMSRYIGDSLEQVVENMANDEYGVGEIEAIPHHTASWSMHTTSWMDVTRFPVHAVHYENLYEDPITELIKILEFCEMEVDEGRVVRAVEACALHKLRVQEAAHGFLENSSKTTNKFFGSGGSRWRDTLDDTLAHQIEVDHKDAMQQCGYLPYELNTLQQCI